MSKINQIIEFRKKIRQGSSGSVHIVNIEELSELLLDLANTFTVFEIKFRSNSEIHIDIPFRGNKN